MFSIEDLTKRCKGQNYRDLQKAAKSSGIKANLKKEELCDKIAIFLKGRKDTVEKKEENCNKLLKTQILDKVYKQPTLTRSKSYYQKMKKADLCNLLESKPKSRSLPASAIGPKVLRELRSSSRKGSKSPVNRLKGKGFTPVKRSPRTNESPYYSPNIRGVVFYQRSKSAPRSDKQYGIEITSPMSPMLSVYD